MLTAFVYSMSQTQSVADVQSTIAPQLVPTTQADIDPIEYASSMTSTFHHDEFEDDMDVDLAQPEFNGLWDKQPAKQEIDPLFNRSKYWKTKMDKDILQRTLTRLKENVVREQVVGTKRYEGTVPFKSDPTEIYFKDFDVGKIYRTRVTLTNVTLTINTLKLVDLSESLKDFITLKFEPPGMISAGMSCYLHVTFEPKINENLRGEIKFLAQTGMFTVPIRCEIKKVELSLDKTSVNVGTTVVDERLHQSITLRNNGGLGTNYRLVKTSVLRREQAENEKDQKKTKEPASTPDVADLVQKEYVEVFTIKAADQGFLASHSSISFPIEFTAPVAGTFHEEYTIAFDQNHSELKFSINAQSIDVPVWVENPSTDFKICMFDRLYQDALVLRNRSSAALRVSVDIQPRALQNHIEIVPRTAYIQAKSSFNLQIKLTARPSIVDDGLPIEIFDPTYSTLIVPLEIKVADQIRTVPFSISAVLTTSDLQFDVEHIDFGCCTTTESVVAKIHLKNNSLLAQPFGFVNLPDYIQVQPNDGFGTLLPEETIPLHVLFSPSATKEYQCTLTCRSLINREFTFDCQGVGVLPPLSLSSTVIHFPATPINDQSIATFYVDNRHLDKNHFRHPVPRIGNGEFAAVGPTSFQFEVPENAPITISPLVGTVEPGTRQKITVRLAPKLDPADIRTESIRIKEADARRQADGKDSPNKGDSKHRSNTISRRRDTTTSTSGDIISPAPEHSNEWSLAQLSMMKSFPSSLASFLIPCYVASGECQRPGILNYDVANTLFLQVHCPIVKPELIVISDYGQTTIDFGSASVGQELSRTVLVQNITDKPIQLRSALLNIDGPFRLLNALRKIEPGGTAPIKLTFTPNATVEFLETLELTSESSKLTLCLKGVGLKPNVQLSFDTNTPFQMGCVLAKDHIEKSFQSILNQYDINTLDYQKGHEISRLSTFFDMPYISGLSISFALFKTYGIPSISRLLVQTDQLARLEVAGRRAEDTGVLLSECFENDLDSPRARMATARINYLHNLYRGRISNDDMLYTLSLFVLEPCRWAVKYDWRPLAPVEGEARVFFWRELGARMGIENIPLTLKDLETWSVNYEIQHMTYSKDNQICGEATIELLLSIYPNCMRKLVRKVFISLVDERLRLAMGFEQPPHWIKQLTIFFFRCRAFLLVHCALPRIYPDKRGQASRSCPMTKDGRYQRTGYFFEPWYVKETWFNAIFSFPGKRPSAKYRSGGFKVTELGPEKFAASQYVNNRIEQENKNVWGATFDSNKHMIGPQNLSGRSVFDITPVNGVIPAGSKKQLTVIFSPDHDSDFFSDLVRITISDQPVKLEFRLRGSGRQNTMFIRPLDNANVVQKSLLPNISDIVTSQMQAIDPTEKGAPNNIVVLLCAQMANGKYVPAQRELMIGCAATSGTKRNGDYSFDNMKDINNEGFIVDNPKTSVEMGTEKAVNEASRATVTVITKGDVTRTWRVVLIGFVDPASLSDKRLLRPSKHRLTIATSTRSNASVTGASQQLTLQESLQEIESPT
ncbi:unnamed protein product [Adineta ricciae]|uniref:Calponin-homology (CH) domain-containing protein n=1 Tax=Adineta ricciae TaxID=249248 RepID=A0A814EFS6_ADIRI|nr:unnamed protein product [Adineta ricciae]CAF0970401.1 unnamed protein product [Adineta ricciae]